MPLRVRWSSLGLMLAACAGGALSGLVVIFFLFLPRLSSWQTVPPYQTLASSTERALQFFLPDDAPRSSTPSALSSRRLSPLAALVKRSGGEWVSEDQRVGNAVALSADGWLVTVWPAVSPLHRAEMGVVWNGRVYPVMQAIQDKATDAVFLKIQAQGLPVTRFTPVGNVTAGSPLWLEPKSKRLYGSRVIDTRLARAEVLSSESVSRRFLISGQVFSHGTGGAVWNEKGELVGLLEAFTTDGWRVLPAHNLDAALTAVLSGQEITHAFLGVRTLDLASVAVDSAATTTPPFMGARIKGVLPGSPAAQMLREGDVIERIERDILDGNADLGERLLEYAPGSQITVFGTRASHPLQVQLILGSVTTSEEIK